MLYKYVLLTKRAVKMAGYWLKDLLCIISLSGKFFSLPHISNIIKKHYNLLLSSNRCKKVFQHLPVVAFRRSPNLRDLLVTAKLSSNSANPQLPPGSFRCGKNCATKCDLDKNSKRETTCVTFSRSRFRLAGGISLSISGRGTAREKHYKLFYFCFNVNWSSSTAYLDPNGQSSSQKHRRFQTTSKY